ncbi:MAG: hypothetical protein H7Z72_03690 [Bacteroidetes bacterium]|nr:hypothetical protein [Fibrella sp.]
MKNKFYRICLWLGILLTPCLAEAQNYGRIYHAYVGYDFVNTQTVDNWMPFNLAYPDMKNGLVSIGIDGFAIRNNIMMGGQLQVKHGPVVRAPRGNLRPYIADLMAQGGYVFINKKGLMVYSTLGVGYGAFATHIFNTRKRYPDFVPSVPAIRENVVLIQQGVVGSLTVGADYFVANHNTDRSKGFALGLRLGYDARPKSDKWQASEYDITGGPSYSASGFFVRLTVGKGTVGPRL